MTDREFLEELATALHVHLHPPPPPPPPAPIDEVLGPWFLTSFSEWGPCQPSGVQTRIETWKRDTLIHAEHGGVLSDEPREETRTGVAPCVWIPPSDPTPVRRTEVEIEVQWWFAPAGVYALDADQGVMHTHMRTRVPRVVSGLWTPPVVSVKTFHQEEGFVQKLEHHMMGDLGYRETHRHWRANFGPGAHMFDVDIPQFAPIDTTLFPTDGYYGIKNDLTIGTAESLTKGLPKGGHLVRSQWSVYVENGKPLHTGGHVMNAGGAGNVDDDASTFRHGYLDIEVHSTTLPDFRGGKTYAAERSIVLEAGASMSKGGVGGSVLATRNPDMHAHPPNLGQLLYPMTTPFPLLNGGPVSRKGFVTLTMPPDHKSGDKLFIRFANNNPVQLAMSAAVVLVLREVPVD